MVKIKSVKKYIAGIKEPGEVPDHRSLRSVFTFDETNNPLEEIFYLPDEKIESRTIFKYNDDLKLIEKTSYQENNEFAERNIFEYQDGTENPDTIIVEYADGSKSIKKIEKNGQEIRIDITDDDGDSEGYETKVLDSNNNILLHSIFDEDHIVQEKIVNTIEEGLLIKKEEYGYEEELNSVTIFKYDENGNQAEEKSYSGEGNLLHQRFSKYENGLIVEDIISDVKVVYYYDENKRRIRTEMVDSNEKTLSFNDYEYNDHGMISRQTSYQMGDRYAMEPNVYARLRSSYILTEYVYELFDEE